MKGASRQWGFTPGEKRAILMICAAFLVASAYRIYQHFLVPETVVISAEDSLAVEAIRKAYSGLTLSRSSDSRQNTDDTGYPGGPINLNTATRTQLEALPGIGPVLAARILEAREKVGLFTKPEDLLSVPGIGAKRLEMIRPLVTCTRPEEMDN